MRLRDGCDLALSYVAELILRFFQLVLALTVIGLYGQDLHRAAQEHKYSDGKWVFAVVTGSLASFTAIIFAIPFVKRIPFIFVGDIIIFILWIALFGVFGNMYIKEHAEGDSGVQRMKNAVWVDLTNALLWLITSSFMVGYWYKHRNTRSQFTGRAAV